MQLWANTEIEITIHTHTAYLNRYGCISYHLCRSVVDVCVLLILNANYMKFILSVGFIHMFAYCYKTVTF